MTSNRKPNSRGLLMLTPIAGCMLFVVLYFIAASLYPGGTNYDKTTIGFDWKTNYWCELLGETATNGSPNSARPVALFAMVVLLVSISAFWLLLPHLFALNIAISLTMQLTGIVSMGFMVFIFTRYHDIVIYTGGVLAFIALTISFIGMYRSRLMSFFWGGLFCMLLLALNNYIHISGNFISSLAVLQKVTFIIVLVWIGTVNVHLYRRWLPR